MVNYISLGDRVYADEQSEFRCNTQQPGCVQVGYHYYVVHYQPSNVPSLHTAVLTIEYANYSLGAHTRVLSTHLF